MIDVFQSKRVWGGLKNGSDIYKFNICTGFDLKGQELGKTQKSFVINYQISAPLREIFAKLMKGVKKGDFKSYLDDKNQRIKNKKIQKALSLKNKVVPQTPQPQQQPINQNNDLNKKNTLSSSMLRSYSTKKLANNSTIVDNLKNEVKPNDAQRSFIDNMASPTAQYNNQLINNSSNYRENNPLFVSEIISQGNNEINL